MVNRGKFMGDIIDLTGRLKARNHKENKPDTKSSKKPPEVLDMTEARQQIINDERRNVKRTILTEFIGAFAVLPERGLLRLSLYDISDRGISFDLEMTEGRFLEGEEVAMRVYLNHKTYFPFIVK